MNRIRTTMITLLLLSMLLCPSFAEVTYGESQDSIEMIDLTEEEKSFVQEHPVIHIGVDPAFIPYEFIDDDGQYKGIAADYISLISDRTGLTFVVEKDLTWANAYEKAVRGELDVLPCVAKTVEREQYFLFSDPYYTFQRVIFVREENNDIDKLEDLYGGSVAVQVNSSHHSYLKNIDDITLHVYKTVNEAILAVSEGTEEAFVGNLATTSYFINSDGITNLKFVTIKTEEPQSLSFAVRKDWPELASILNKALESIDRAEKIEINNRWIGVENGFDYKGLLRVVGIVGSVIMITLAVSFFWNMKLRKEVKKRRQTEQELELARKEAEMANEIKSMFLARMSHEIRTPLNALMGMSYLMRKTDLTITQGIYLDKLAQTARNMLGIINDILDFSKIEAGKIELEAVSFNIDKVLQHVLNIVSIKVEEQGIELVMDRDPNMPPVWIGDPSRIEQILINLINNAIKFTETGGVTLSVRSVVHRFPEQRSSLVFTVSDTGIGMNEDQLLRLFTPFEQGDSTINRRYGGTGLGLSIVKNLVELMEGTIEAKSEIGSGSTFTIHLPLAIDEQENGENLGRIRSAGFEKLRAMVLVEGEKERGLLADCFRSFGIAVDLTSDEEEAMHLLRRVIRGEYAPYDLLLVDYMTPKEDAVTFRHNLIERELITSEQKYMVVVPLNRTDLFELFQKEGIAFGMVKPIIPSVLYDGIMEMFSLRPVEMKQSLKHNEIPVSSIPYHILLVEDNKTNQYIAEIILEQAGLCVSKADDGASGVALYREQGASIDLILMDIHMPVMDGYTASEKIREIDQVIPIVAMTADAIVGVDEKCAKSGMNLSITKPFEPEALLKLILELLEGHPKKHSASAQLDRKQGVLRIGGNEEIYQRILESFYEENKMVETELRELIEKKAFGEVIGLLHKLKSAAGGIGANGLWQQASAFQKMLEDNDSDTEQINAQLEVSVSLLNQLLSEIRASSAEKI